MNDDRTQNIAFVILAAGESKRMGDRIKQLLQWQNKSLINHLIDKSIDSRASETFIVLGANADEIRKEIEGKPVQVIFNNDWSTGLSSSIATAAKHIANLSEKYAGILISLVDQPLVSTAQFNHLINEFNKGDSGIVATTYSGSIGVPAIFSNSYFENLAQLTGSKGAKSIIQANRQDCTLLPDNNTSVDLDTPEDYLDFLKKHSQS